MAAEPQAPSAFLNRLLTVWTKLVSGNFVAQAINLAAFAIASHTIGVAAIGGIAIIQSVVRLGSDVLVLRTALPTTRLGAEAHVAGDMLRLSDILKAGVAVEAATSLIAALVAASFLFFMPGWLGIPGDLAKIAPFYAIVTVVGIRGLPFTVLRLFDALGWLAVAEVAGAVVRIGLFTIVALAGKGPATILLMWLLSEIFISVLMLAAAGRILRQHGVPPFRMASVRRAFALNSSLKSLIWSTNGVTSMNAVVERGDIVLVGWLGGAEMAGLLKAAKSFAQPLLQFGQPIQHVVLPEVSRLWADGARRHFLRIGLTGNAVGLAIGLAASLLAIYFGEEILSFAAGDAFSGGATAFALLTVAYGLRVASVANVAMILAMDEMFSLLLMTLAAMFAWAAIVVVMIGGYGADGAAIAAVTHSCILLLLTALIIAHGFRGRPKVLAD